MSMLQRIRLDHPQPAGMRRLQLRQRRHRPAVEFHRRHRRGGAGQQGAGQAAGAGADLQHMPAVEVAGQGGDAPAERLIQQEMLAERLPRLQPMPRRWCPEGREGRRRSAPHLDGGAAAQVALQLAGEQFHPVAQQLLLGLLGREFRQVPLFA